MSKQTPLGLTTKAMRIEGNVEVQCKLCDLIRRFAESNPATTLEDLIDYDLLMKEDLCEEHICRLSMRYEGVVNKAENIRMCEITVQMVAEIMYDVLPLALVTQQSAAHNIYAD